MLARYQQSVGAVLRPDPDRWSRCSSRCSPAASVSERVAAVDPVHPRAVVRDQGPAVPQGRRLLRLPAAVPVVRLRLALRGADHHPRSSPRSRTTSTAASGCRRPFQRVTPQVKAHLSVILALMALVKTVQYFLARYELNFSTRGVVEGASKTDVAAQLPALNLLMVISVVAAGAVRLEHLAARLGAAGDRGRPVGASCRS